MIGGIGWSNLQSFLALAREERLTGAARKLGVDHTTLKRRIDIVEAALGAALFERKPTGYQLTAAGHNVLAILEEMESVSLRLSSDFDGLRRDVQGTIRIAAPDVFGNKFLAPRLPILAQAHPGLEIELVSTPRSTSLTKREADLVVTGSQPQSGRLHTRKLTGYEIGLYASESYLAEARAVAKPADLMHHPLVGYIDELILTPGMNSLRLLDPTLKARISCTNILYQMVVIKAGGGIGMLPCWLAEEESDLVRILATEVAFERTYWLNLTSDMRTNPTIRAVRDFIVEQVLMSKRLFQPPVRS